MKTAVIHPNVKIGKNAQISDYVILGFPPKNKKSGELPLVIGDKANIRSHTIIYAGTKIGDNLETGHGVLIRENNKIGNNCRIGTNTVIEDNNIIKDGVHLHSNCFIPQLTVIEEGAWIGPSVVLTNDKYPPHAKNMKGPTIGKNAKIGANSTILPGIKIGENSLIGAGSVVTKDVPPSVVVVGNPARVIKKIGDISGYSSG